MFKKNRFWDFLIDPDRPLQGSAYKKTILLGQLSLLSVAVGIAYIFFDWWNGVYANLPYYGVLIAAALVTLILNRRNQSLAAKVVFLLLMNFLVYIFASGDTYRSGVYSYFLVTSFTALTLCGFEQLKLGLFFVAISITLFILGYVFHLSPMLPRADFPEQYLTMYFTTNFIVSVLTVSTLLFFLLDLNHTAEKELIQNNELLTKTNQELDRFVYSASHDLRSPLSSILGLVEIARKSGDPQEVNMCLNLIEDRVKVQDSFIYEIIEYARNARMQSAPEAVPLRTLVFEAIDQLAYMKDATDVDIQVLVAADTVLHTDRVRLKSILSNLIGNAIKYHDKMKTDRFIKISTAAAPGALSILIEDNGQGIPRQFHEKIFDMFFRASENSKGSGLGLFIVKETIAKLHGTVGVQSEHGRGSCFTVTLPV